MCVLYLVVHAHCLEQPVITSRVRENKYKFLQVQEEISLQQSWLSALSHDSGMARAMAGQGRAVWSCGLAGAGADGTRDVYVVLGPGQVGKP